MGDGAALEVAARHGQRNLGAAAGSPAGRRLRGGLGLCRARRGARYRQRNRRIRRGLDGSDWQRLAAIGRNLSPGALQAFAGLTQLGEPVTLSVLGVTVAAALLARAQLRLMLVGVLAVAGKALLNVTLKGVVERARPLRTQGLEQVSGWGFPNGHSSGSVVAYGMLACVLVRTLSARWQVSVVMLAAALALSIGCSRIFLQLHCASDVAAGFASGMTWLTICIVASEWGRLGPVPGWDAAVDDACGSPAKPCSRQRSVWTGRPDSLIGRRARLRHATVAMTGSQ